MKINLKNKKLAINGGDPLRNTPWLENLNYGEKELKAVMSAMDSGLLSFFEGSHKPLEPFSFWGGPFIQNLEKDWCNYYKVKYSVSVNSATSGLYAAIGALGLGYGDEVITSPYTMSACSTAPLIYGAIPIFADVKLETGSVDPDSIEKLITERTKAIIVIHQFGIPADMDRIMDIANRYELNVIEDCAQAHGAKYKGQFVGTFGDIGVFSLNVNKTIQTGEGGVCVTNNEELRYRLALIRNHGENVVESAEYTDITNIVGYNYRLTEIQAAIAIEQLKKLDYFNKVRIEYVDVLSENLSKYDFFEPLKAPYDCFPTYYVFSMRYKEDFLKMPRSKLIQILNSEGFPIFYGGYTRPLYLLPIYQKKMAFKNGYPFTAPENSNIKTNYYLGACPNAERLYNNEYIGSEHIRLPHTTEDIQDILSVFKKIFN